LFGSTLIVPGAIFTAAGHLSEHLRPSQISEEESEVELARPLKVCVKCGRQVDPSASYCQNCGNQLSKS
jgi:predicted amidophosphoribosyltransferase